MKVQKSKVGVIVIISTLLLLAFQNCGQQLVTISSVNSGYQDANAPGNSAESIDSAIKKVEVKINPLIAIEGEDAKVSFTLSQKVDRSVEIILNPINEIAQAYVEQKKIATRHIFAPGESALELSLPKLKLPSYSNQKIEFEVTVTDEKSAFVSSKSFNIFVVPAANSHGAASITADDQVMASDSLKGSIILLNKSNADSNINWEIQSVQAGSDLNIFPTTSGTFVIPAGQQFSTFSIQTNQFQDYMTDKAFALRLTGGENVKLLDSQSLVFKVRDQKPHAAPILTKDLASLISKDFRNGVKLSLSTSGIPSPSYQWFVNGQLVAGNLSEFNLPSPTEAKQFLVKAVAKNVFGEVASSEVTVAFGCANNETIKNGMCEVNTVRECAIAYGVGQQTWMTDRWSSCVPLSCNVGFTKKSMSCGCADNQHLQDGKCVSNSMSCTIANGTGTKTWNGSEYGACTVVFCNSSFSAFGNTCACRADQTLDTTDNLCKYTVKKWVLLANYDSTSIPVRCSGSYKPFSRPVNGTYNVSGIIIAGSSPWLDPHSVDPGFTVSIMRVIETSTCGGEFLDGGYPGTNTLCYSRSCAMKMYRVGEGLSLTK